MVLYVPLSLIFLASISGTIAGLLGIARMVALRPIARRFLGTGSLLAGIGWCVAYLLICQTPLAIANDPPPPLPPLVESPVEGVDESAKKSPASESLSPELAERTQVEPPLVERPLNDEPRTLSVEPRESVGLAKIDRQRRPAWVESPAQRIGPLHSTAVSSGPWLSPDEGRRALDEQLVKATQEYVAELIHNPRSGMLASSYDMAYVKNHLLKRENIYEEQVEGELSGSTYQVHALLEFDEGFRAEVHRRWRAIVTEVRLIQTALGGGGILLAVALLFGLLRADTATRGYYTRTLQLVAAVAILGIVAAGVLLAKSIPWL